MHRASAGFLLTAAFAALVLAGPAAAQTVPALSSGQVLYLPIYSHIYHGDQDRHGRPSQTLVSTHVSIRNTDPQVPLRILYARYYDTEGKLVREFLRAPLTVPPLGTHELFVPRGDVSGGSGANFLIAWAAGEAANQPLVEALHADVQAARTLIFVTTARPITPR